MTVAEDYNRDQFDRNLITYDHVDELMHLLPGILDHAAPSFVRRVELFQKASRLTVDGKLGPNTRRTLSKHREDRIAHVLQKRLENFTETLCTTLQNDPLSVNHSGFLAGRNVQLRPSHPTWYSGPMAPRAIIWHNTDTGPGTARAMSRRRMRRYGSSPDDRPASWHVTIETDGSIWHQVPLDHIAWHAGGKNKKPLRISGRDYHPNDVAIGIELVGDGLSFTDEQVTAAARVLDAIVRRFKIPRANADVLHRDVNRSKNCPQKWDEYLPAVLDAVYR